MRQHILIESDTEPPRLMPCDPANVERQIREYEALGYRAIMVDDDDLINLSGPWVKP